MTIYKNTMYIIVPGARSQEPDRTNIPLYSVFLVHKNFFKKVQIFLDKIVQLMI